MSGYTLHQSDDLEKLLSEHLDVLIGENSLDTSNVIILRDKPMRTWFSLQVSKRRGIAFNIVYKTPMELILEILEEYDESQKLIFHDDLYFLVLKELEKMEQEKDKNLFSTYLSASKDILSRERKRSHLAKEISKYLYDYFSEGSDYLLKLKLSPNEIYRLQYRIYESIFIKQNYQELYGCLEKIQKENKTYDGKLKQISVFGSNFLSPPFLRFFKSLSHSIDVHHFLWVPSKTFFLPYHEIKNDIKESPIQKWTNPLRKNLILLEQNSEMIVKTGYSSVISLENSLSIIKNSLYQNKNEKQPLVFDESFQIFSAKTQKRELEVIKDKILALLDEDTTLDLNDIAVLAPNIGEYAAFIEEVFAREDTPIKLAYNIIDLKVQEESKLKQGFFSFLDLTFSRFEVGKILSLFNNPYFKKAKNFSEEDIDVLKAIIKTYDVKWAMNEEHKESLNLGNLNTFTFSHAFEELYEAIISGGKENPNIESDTRQIIASFLEIFDALYLDIKELRYSKKSIESWAAHLSKLLEKYFYSAYLSDEDKSEIIALRTLIKKLYQTERDLSLKDNFNYKDKTYGLTSILGAITSFSSGKRKGHYSATGITFSSLIPFRATPFKITFVIGLNEEKSLSEKDSSGIDFEKETPRGKEENEEKQFALLESLYTAEKKLILSYLDFDWQRKEEREPSILIEELLYFLIQTFDFPQIEKEINKADDLLNFLRKKSAFHSFDVEHFKQKSSLASYNTKAFSILKTFSPPQDVPFETPEIQVEISKNILLKDIKIFLRDPARLYMNKTLNIYIQEEDPMEIDEKLDIDPRNISKVKREALEKIDFESSNPNDLKETIEDLFSSFKKNKTLSFLDLAIDKEKDRFQKLATSLKSFLNKDDYQFFSTEDLEPLIFEEFLIDGRNITLYQSSRKNYLSFTLGDSDSHRCEAYVEMLYLFNNKNLEVENLFYFFIGKTSIKSVHLQKEEAFEKNLKDLLFLYQKNLESPILLYPDLATTLKSALKKGSLEEIENKIDSYFKEKDSNFGAKKMFRYQPYAEFFLGELQSSPFSFAYEGMLKKMMEDVYLPLNTIMELTNE